VVRITGVITESTKAKSICGELQQNVILLEYTNLYKILPDRFKAAYTHWQLRRIS